MDGENGNDHMFGDDDDDRLNGGHGSDMIRGGTGNDHVYGNSGHDDLRHDQNEFRRSCLSTPSSSFWCSSAGSSEFKASLSGTGYGMAEFENERGEREFEVEIRNAPTNASFTVLVGSINVGQFQTNGLGEGKLKFEYGQDSDSRAFPSSFPDIKAGMQIKVGNILSGTFGASR